MDEALEQYLPPGDLYPSRIHEPMRYSVFVGGKRLRPILLLAAAEAVGFESRHALPLASAIELIHTYSLLHDDLPAMDNSDTRRGQPSCHKRYGEAIAILTGDALLTLAFSIISQECFARLLCSDQLSWILREIAQASGAEGLIGGQTMDIISQGEEVDLSVLRYIHEHKTGALIRACLRLGGIVARASCSQLQSLTEYGERIGLAFQIRDDILDLDEETQVGKKLGKDMDAGKATYPRLLGLEESERELQRLVEEANRAICSFPDDKAQPLRCIANHIIHRRN